MVVDFKYRDCLFILVAVYGRMRAVLVNTPSLWTFVDIEWHASLVNAFIARSGSLRLNINVGTATPSSSQIKRVLDIFPRISSLYYWHSYAESKLFLKKIGEANACALQKATVCMKHVSKNALPAAIFGNIVSLKLFARIASFPPMTLLRDLHLCDSYITLPELHHFIGQNVELRCLQLDSNVLSRSHQPSEDFGTDTVSLTPLRLPELKSLMVEERISHANSLLRILPTPRLHFRLHVIDKDGPSRVGPKTSSSGLNEVIVEYLTSFWTSVHDTSSRLPNGSIIIGGRYRNIDLVICGGNIDSHWDSSPALDFKCSYAPSETNLDLSLVDTLVVNMGQGVLSQMYSPLFTYAPTIRKLRMQRATHTGNYSKPAFQELEEWIIQRHQAGPSFECIEFFACRGPGFHTLYEHLTEAGIANSVV
jgi:hypothetical protein